MKKCAFKSLGGNCILIGCWCPAIWLANPPWKKSNVSIYSCPWAFDFFAYYDALFFKMDKKYLSNESLKNYFPVDQTFWGISSMKCEKN